MPHPHLAVEASPAGYQRVCLARPERRNALDVSLLRAVTEALAAEPGVPVLLASTDPRVFCAGADLTMTDAERAAVSDLVYDCCETIVTRPGPVIAVLTGPAVGGGAQLAAASDLRIAGPSARLRWTGPPGLELAVRDRLPVHGDRDPVRACAGGRGRQHRQALAAEPRDVVPHVRHPGQVRPPSAQAPVPVTVHEQPLMNRPAREPRPNGWPTVRPVGGRAARPRPSPI